MATVDVRSTSDAVVALDAGAAFLAARPEHNSIILSVLAERVARYEGGRYWWARRDGEVVGYAMQSPPRFRAVAAPASRDVVAALVDVMAEDAPDLPGVMSDAATAVVFAGRWAEVRGVPVMPVEAQRIHRIRTVRAPEGVPGTLRPAEPADRAVLLRWTVAFLRDTGSNPFDPDSLVDRHMTSGRLWLWDVGGEPVSMAAASATAAGVARVAFVYTPAEHRRHGYAAAGVAALSTRLLGQGVNCILHTQLHNPTSNGVYRRIGYEPMGEVLIYRFG
jgi:predicted GNAT family acetyltransferase